MNTPTPDADLEEARKLAVPCGYCKGEGWTTEHDSPSNHSPEDGSCLTCPVQEQCEYCHATGFVVPIDSVAQALRDRERKAVERAVEAVEPAVKALVDKVVGTTLHLSPREVIDAVTAALNHLKT